MIWWRRFWRRDRLERELDDELRFHYGGTCRRERCAPASLPNESADARPVSEFGGLEQVKEQCRHARVHPARARDRAGSPDALRSLRKERALSMSAVVVLSLGIGVNNMLFTIVNAHCIRGLPVEHTARLLCVRVRPTRRARIGRSRLRNSTPSNPPAQWRQLQAGKDTAGVLIDDAMPADRVTIAYVSPATLPLLSEQLVLGRGLQTDDDRAGAQPVVLIGESLWNARLSQQYHHPRHAGAGCRRSHHDRSACSTTSCRFPDNADVWLALAQGPARQGAASSARSLEAIGLPARDITRQQAEEELTRLGLDAQVGSPPSEEAPIQLKVSPINEVFNGKLTSRVWLAFFTVGVLLVMIAFFNVANLMLAP